MSQTRVAWWAEDAHAVDGIVPGIKMVSFVCRRPELTSAEFDLRYANHMEVARVHHGMWMYAQNVVTASHGGPDTPPLDAVSELWFRSIDDWTQNMYRRADSPAAVREDTTAFIDFGRTWSVLVQTHIG